MFRVCDVAEEKVSRRGAEDAEIMGSGSADSSIATGIPQKTLQRFQHDSARHNSTVCLMGSINQRSPQRPLRDPFFRLPAPCFIRVKCHRFMENPRQSAHVVRVPTGPRAIARFSVSVSRPNNSCRRHFFPRPDSGMLARRRGIDKALSPNPHSELRNRRARRWICGTAVTRKDRSLRRKSSPRSGRRARRWRSSATSCWRVSTSFG